MKVIGFAAETQDVVKNAKKKLNEKKLDLIIANDVSDSSIGFDSDENEVYLITKKIEKKIEKISKKKLSRSSLVEYLKYQTVQNSKTIIQNIYSVPPASYSIIKKELNLSFHKYWNISDIKPKIFSLS